LGFFDVFLIESCTNLIRFDLEADYQQAFANMAEYACESLNREWDTNLLKSVLSLMAILKGSRDLGELIINIDDGEEKQVLEMYFDR
jgi:hypothetical protein